MPDVHALLSASSSKRWLNCPPSVRLEEGFPNESSVYAEEGTYAHEVCEYKIRRYLRENNDGSDRLERPHSEQFDSDEIEQITDVYYEFVVGVIEEMKKSGGEPLVLVEERVNYSHIAPSGFGTADMLILGKDEEGRGVLHIVDFKAGRGVYVDCDHNPQMMLYAIGGLHAYGYIHDVETVRMTIVQPRLDNISTFEMTAEELQDWGESIRPVAKLAYEGKGEQKTGEWCRFCRAKPVCKACAEEALALAREEFLDLDAAPSDSSALSDPSRPEDMEDEDNSTLVFKQPGLIPFSELTELLPSLNRISSWIDAVFSYVSAEAINHGAEIPGYKVVEGRSKRTFTDTKAVEETAIANGYTEVYKQQLLTLTEFEKMMGKKRFAELLGEYVAKPPGKLTLVPESDPRPPVDVNRDAVDEFDVL